MNQAALPKSGPNWFKYVFFICDKNRVFNIGVKAVTLF